MVILLHRIIGHKVKIFLIATMVESYFVTSNLISIPKKTLINPTHMKFIIKTQILTAIYLYFS